MTDQVVQSVVWLIGPESGTYHVDPNCPALRNPARQWPVHRGVLLSNGTIQCSDLSRSYYTGRTRCKRCGPWATVGASENRTPNRGQNAT